MYICILKTYFIASKGKKLHTTLKGNIIITFMQSPSSLAKILPHPRAKLLEM